MFYFSSDVVDKKIEEFLSSFEEKIENLTEDAFNTQVIVLASYFVGSPKPSTLVLTVLCAGFLSSVAHLNLTMSS